MRAACQKRRIAAALPRLRRADARRLRKTRLRSLRAHRRASRTEPRLTTGRRSPSEANSSLSPAPAAAIAGGIRHRGSNLFHPLAHLDDLDRAGRRMRLDPPPLGPGIGFVVMIDIGDEQAVFRLVHDQSQIAADAYRPEIRVLRLVDPVERQALAGGIDLQIDDRRLDRLRLRRGQSGQRAGEAVGEQKAHSAYTR